MNLLISFLGAKQRRCQLLTMFKEARLFLRFLSYWAKKGKNNARGKIWLSNTWRRDVLHLSSVERRFMQVNKKKLTALTVNTFTASEAATLHLLINVKCKCLRSGRYLGCHYWTCLLLCSLSNPTTLSVFYPLIIFLSAVKHWRHMDTRAKRKQDKGETSQWRRCQDASKRTQRRRV